MDFHNNILLTGAGFSKNFGGYLATELWSKIFNHPDTNKAPSIKTLLRNDFDYENIIYTINKINSIYDKDEIQIFNKIIIDVYNQMDEEIEKKSNNSQNALDIDKDSLDSLLAPFRGTHEKPGIHFTLNQDLLIERLTDNIPYGFRTDKYNKHSACFHRAEVDMPSQEDIESLKFDSMKAFGYIKLHGSLNWYKDGPFGRNMVIGKDKEFLIGDDPLLHMYSYIFNQAISRDNINLVIIGYSFRDNYINQLICDALDNHTIKLTIISPQSPEKFKSNLSKCGSRPKISNKIWQSINNYYPYTLNEFIPKGNSGPTNTMKDFLRNLN